MVTNKDGNRFSGKYDTFKRNGHGCLEIHFIKNVFVMNEFIYYPSDTKIDA